MLLDVIEKPLEGFGYTRTFTDEYGTFYFWLEGSHGGETILIWLEEEQLEDVLRGLRGLCYRGRIALAVHGLPGLATPLARAVHWTDPRKVLIVTEGEGVGTHYEGGKEVSRGGWVPWNDPRPALQIQCIAPSGLEFCEPRAYVPWQHPLLIDTLTFIDGPFIGGQARFPSYGLGREGLGPTLRMLLKVWRLLEEQ